MSAILKALRKMTPRQTRELVDKLRLESSQPLNGQLDRIESMLSSITSSEVSTHGLDAATALKIEKMRNKARKDLLKLHRERMLHETVRGLSHAFQNVGMVLAANPVTAYLIGWEAADLLEKGSYNDWYNRKDGTGKLDDASNFHFPFITSGTGGALKTALTGLATAYAASPLAAAALPGLLALVGRRPSERIDEGSSTPGSQVLRDGIA